MTGARCGSVPMPSCSGPGLNPVRQTSILEIGTGCGVISLMLAQKSDARIVAIDSDEESVNQAGANFHEKPMER